MKIVALFLLSIVSLSGCALTRVSSSAHNKEVNELALVGLSYKDAVEKATKEGFKCYTHLEFQPYKSTRAGGKEVMQRTCWKASMQLVCPQRRYVHFEYSVADERVVTMWPTITEQSCF
jgi:hypothetical protein